MIKNLAGVGKRILGAVIDIIVLLVIFVLFCMLFGEAKGDFICIITGLPAFVMFLVCFLYFVVMEVITGKTIGKYIAKTRVVNEAGEKISWGQSIGRNLMRIVDGFFVYLVGFISILASKNNQRLGDMVSKTYVING